MKSLIIALTLASSLSNAFAGDFLYTAKGQVTWAINKKRNNRIGSIAIVGNGHDAKEKNKLSTEEMLYVTHMIFNGGYPRITETVEFENTESEGSEATAKEFVQQKITQLLQDKGFQATGESVKFQSIVCTKKRSLTKKSLDCTAEFIYSSLVRLQ